MEVPSRHNRTNTLETKKWVKTYGKSEYLKQLNNRKPLQAKFIISQTYAMVPHITLQFRAGKLCKFYSRSQSDRCL